MGVFAGSEVDLGYMMNAEGYGGQVYSCLR